VIARRIQKDADMIDRSKLLPISGWAITLAVTLFMLGDVTADVQRLPWAVIANAGLGVPSNLVFAIGITGLVCTLVYLAPPTTMLGAIRMTGLLGGAVSTHVRVNGDVSDIGENIGISVLAWTGLWLRDARIRTLLPITRNRAQS
jgi:hypothetical protein